MPDVPKESASFPALEDVNGQDSLFFNLNLKITYRTNDGSPVFDVEVLNEKKEEQPVPKSEA